MRIVSRTWAKWHSGPSCQYTRWQYMDKKGPLELYRDRMRSFDRRYWLRPMTAAEILDASVRLYQSRAGKILSGTALSMVPCYLALIFATTYLVPNLFLTETGSDLGSGFSKVVIAGLVTVLIALPLFVFGFSNAMATTIKTAKPYLYGEDTAPEPVTARETWNLFGTLFLTFTYALSPLWMAAVMFIIGGVVESTSDSLLSGLAAVAGGFLIFLSIIVVPYLTYRWMLAAPVSVLEGLGVRASMRRASELIRSHALVPSLRDAYLSIVFVFAVLVAILVAGFMVSGQLLTVSDLGTRVAGSSPWGRLIDQAIGMAPGYLVVWFLAPLWVCMVTVAYIDRRVRLESLDIRVLTQDIHNAAEARRAR